MEQLAILGTQIGVRHLPIVAGEERGADRQARQEPGDLGGYDVYMLDTAGRLHIDEDLDARGRSRARRGNPRETLLVVDGLTGQDAVKSRRVRRQDRRLWRCPHAYGWRRSRWGSAVHARGHRQADQVRRHGRKDGRA